MTKRTSIQAIDSGSRIADRKGPQTRILAEVVYGLSSRDCKGMGICKINAVDSPDYQAGKAPCGASLAYLQVVNSSTIRFTFLKSSIMPEQYALRFAGGYFCLEEAFAFSDHLSTALETTNICIPEGVYPIQDGEQFIIVDFLQS
ncbi:MAG: hypothetical protein SFV55_22310 [Haliscomenobacter sp.]|uniref:hypothetical protein n=1 Tax=Haliscomenobacter sp. TaxID=2717303 RepID=UPI0029BF20C8|nr:hypothetical protein [Haliscomenobacter sp.]MDX2071180.1 hypothetical protein [Haliscomenobacter sp.]